MKSKLFLLLGLSIFILSCSSDDSSDNGDPATSLPIISGNYWTYDVFNHETANTPASFARDSVYVGNDTLINTVTFKKIKTLTIANGFYSGTLKDNGLRIDGNKMRISGSVNFSAGLPAALTFSVSDFIVLKENASIGEELSSTTGSFTQDFNSTPLTFYYSLRSVADGSQNSLASSGNNYSDITKTKVILNLRITADFGLPITVMPAQDVLVSTQYYSKNIGMVYNLTNINYTLSTLPAGYQLPIPQTGSQTQEEFLDVYQVN
ncbi:hypothetical protein [uncultured Flavobacterium sp.]|uniref:hypothetical protein n=1 Tax=uncultured Flavobacterium sp. TaxID=165435 RepID=UPI0030EC035B